MKLYRVDEGVVVEDEGSAYLCEDEWNELLNRNDLLREDFFLRDNPFRSSHIYNPDEPWVGSGAENPSMVLIRGVYYLLFSYNYWISPNYSTASAMCAGQ